MTKSTVYLPEEIKNQLREVAAREQRSEADIIRESIELNLRLKNAPRPTLPLFQGAPSDLAENSDAYLEGYGEK